MTIEHILRNDPLFVGFERIFDRMNTVTKFANVPQQKYPPYNIVKTGENTYLIEVAVAGFKEEDFDIELHDSILTIKGEVKTNEDVHDYIYQGIASRGFERRFTLADTVVVESVSLDQGMLTVRLVNEIPELKIAIISVLFANLEVNHITDKNKKIGNNRFAK
jgi:molecular chaperone IbpA